MNNIERIIKYLSNEMDAEEQRLFKEQLSSDSDFMEEYRSIYRIWEIAKEKLTLEELSELDEKEELIAAVIAAHDVSLYGSDRTSEKEKAFQAQLEEIMKKRPSDRGAHRKKNIQLYYLSGLLAAAAITILILVFRPSTDLQETALSYYDPSNDPLLELYAQQTRSQNLKALHLFKEGNYESARYYFEENQPLIEQNDITSLFYAITCYETGEADMAEELLHHLLIAGEDSIAYHAKWYLALIYISQDQQEMALPYLHEISETEGIFRQKAEKIIKKSDQS
jgi:hypothetical protein